MEKRKISAEQMEEHVADPAMERSFNEGNSDKRRRSKTDDLLRRYHSDHG